MDNQYPSDPNYPIGGAPMQQGGGAPVQPGGQMPMQQGGMGDGPLLPDDSDLKISNTGQRVAAIMVVVLVVAAAIAALVFMQGKQKEIEKIEDVKAAFQKAHNAGYVEFWKKVQVDVKSMKTNADFEARLRQVTVDPVRYAKHVKEAGLAILDKSLPDYKAIVAPPELQKPLEDVGKAVENMRATWDDFASEYLKLEDYYAAVENLETASSHWLGWQQKPGTDKYLLNAVRYFKMMSCIMNGKPITDLAYESMESEITNTCAKGDEKAEWFRRFAFECAPMLKSGTLKPDELFAAAVEKAQEQNDTTSKFGIDTCIKRTKEEFESEEIQKLAGPWMAYIKAQNALLDAIDAKLKALK